MTVECVREGNGDAVRKGVRTMVSAFALPVPSDATLGDSSHVASTSYVSTFTLPKSGITCFTLLCSAAVLQCATLCEITYFQK